MSANDIQVIKRLGQATAGGAIGRLSLVVLVIGFDISSIATMMDSVENAVIASLFIGASLAKGAIFGFAFATAGLGRPRRVAHRVAAPLVAAIPVQA